MDTEVAKPILIFPRANIFVKHSPFPPDPPIVTSFPPISYIQFVLVTDTSSNGLSKLMTLGHWYCLRLQVGAFCIPYPPNMSPTFQSITSPHCF